MTKRPVSEHKSVDNAESEIPPYIWALLTSLIVFAASTVSPNVLDIDPLHARRGGGILILASLVSINSGRSLLKRADKFYYTLRGVSPEAIEQSLRRADEFDADAKKISLAFAIPGAILSSFGDFLVWHW